MAVITSNNDYIKKDKLLIANDARNLVTQASAQIVAENADNLANNLNNKQRLLLRKTTLPKGYFISGEVYFPYNKEAKWYDFHIKTENSGADFLYRQNLIYHNKK